MTREEVVQLMKETPLDLDQKQRFLRGLQIIARYDDDLDSQLCFEHDQVYCGDFDALVEKMTREEIIEMAQCGWFLSEDAWSYYA